ncbi:hypothetical protein OB905_01220 [Halobacteria archaeon AArc-dxtr1]|nr:hypothetical protein [Halobacteria archaeon AArc-dxtr1]
MSAARVRLPPTTGWALALAAVVGVPAISAVSPLASVGAGCGVVLALALTGFGGSTRRIAASAALLAFSATVAVAVVGAGGLTLASALAAVGVALGIAAGLAPATRRKPSSIRRSGTAALFAAAGAAALAVIAFGSAEPEGVVRAIGAGLWFTSGLTGFALAIGAAALAAGVAIAVLPPAAFATPTEYGAYVRTRRALLSWLAVAAVVAILAAGMLAAGARVLTPVDPLVAALVDGPVPRAASAIVTVAGAFVAALALPVRHSWATTRSRENAVVPIVAGAVCGVLLAFPATLAATGGRIALVGSLFGVTAAALAAAGLLAVAWSAPLASRADAAVALSIVVALGSGGVIIGASVDGPLSAETARLSVAALVSLGAALFAYDVGRYGRVLSREVGAEGAAREPQYARIVWSGLIAAVGVLVAVVGLVAAALLAPALSVPATAAVFAGLSATVAAAWLFRR